MCLFSIKTLQINGTSIEIQFVYDDEILSRWNIIDIDMTNLRQIECHIVKIINIEKIKYYLKQNLEFDINEYIEIILTKYFEQNEYNYNYNIC